MTHEENELRWLFILHIMKEVRKVNHFTAITTSRVTCQYSASVSRTMRRTMILLGYYWWMVCAVVVGSKKDGVKRLVLM